MGIGSKKFSRGLLGVIVSGTIPFIHPFIPVLWILGMGETVPIPIYWLLIQSIYCLLMNSATVLHAAATQLVL